MRVLVVTQNWAWLNPTSHLIIKEIARHPGVFITGRKFSEKFQTYDELVKAKGRFDVAVLDAWTLLDDPPRVYHDCCVKGLADSGIPIILNLIQVDLHTISKEFVQTFLDRATCYINAASDQSFWLSDFSTLYRREGWLYPDYITTHPGIVDSKFVLMPHCLSSREFSSPHRRRPIDVTVPGVGYYFRRMVREKLLNVGGKKIQFEDPKYQKAIAQFSANYSSHFGGFLGGSFLAQHLYRRKLFRSKVGITCHGTVNYPLRKFFEIPAAGCLLLANMFQPASALGFVHMENCVDIGIEKLDEIEEILDWAISDSAEARRIAQAGQDMVREYHTVDVRIKQILQLCQQVAAGTFTSVSWSDGRPIFN